MFVFLKKKKKSVQAKDIVHSLSNYRNSALNNREFIKKHNSLVRKKSHLR